MLSWLGFMELIMGATIYFYATSWIKDKQIGALIGQRRTLMKMTVDIQRSDDARMISTLESEDHIESDY